MKAILSTTLLLFGPTLVRGLCQKYVDAATTAAANLQSAYFSGGTYPSQPVWISAVDAWHLQRLDGLTGASTYSGVINTVFTNYENELQNGGSYDDVQWVSVAYLSAGNVDMAKKYYDIASTAVDSSYCGGGLFWSSARDYKNAITNELYLATSGYLYDVTQDTQYLTNLKNTWEWFNASALRGSNGLYNDGLSKDGLCANNGQTQWTYNQGVVLVGLGFLYKCMSTLYTKDESAISTAWSIMDAILADLVDNGALRESCDSATATTCNNDQVSFKGILVEYMAWFLSITGRDNGTKYSDFIKLQADKVLQNAVGSAGSYSNLWYSSNAGGAVWTAPSQGAALGAFVAAGAQSC
ncbi:glycoside hydrolase family 76 protein [Armillaria gallica]|uniref:Glycoside hydrolase family 76 protein n=1 Tax=Armillaria gallica TaxID=47427 RepID=A0A2H3DIZ0_ARMGA|nr:glycoside hydrolase family 76 protein [Armillaria gallica]